MTRNELPQILIVEDDLIISDLLEIILLEMGYGITGRVQTGEEALESAAKKLPDFALMDITLKGAMDGIETSTRLMQDSGIPVLFLTGQVSGPIIEQAKSTGPLGFIQKPFTQEELAAALGNAIQCTGEKPCKRQQENKPDNLTFLECCASIMNEDV